MHCHSKLTFSLVFHIPKISISTSSAKIFLFSIQSVYQKTITKNKTPNTNKQNSLNSMAQKTQSFHSYLLAELLTWVTPFISAKPTFASGGWPIQAVFTWFPYILPTEMVEAVKEQDQLQVRFKYLLVLDLLTSHLCY